MTEQFPPANAKADKAAAKAYAKAQRPFYKKKRVLIPTAILGIAVISSLAGGGGGTAPVDTARATSSSAPATTESKTPAAPAAAKPKPAAITVTAKELIDTLEANALKAKNTYNDKQVTVSGFVGSIDASGDYFALLPEPDAIVFTGVQVRTDEKFQDQLATFTQGQAVTVTGKIDDVGEVLGYQLKAETIK